MNTKAIAAVIVALLAIGILAAYALKGQGSGAGDAGGAVASPTASVPMEEDQGEGQEVLPAEESPSSSLPAESSPSPEMTDNGQAIPPSPSAIP